MFDRSALEKFEEIVKDTIPIATEEINGVTYTKDSLKRIDPYIPRRELMEVNSLKSLVALIKSDLSNNNVNLPIRLVVDERMVSAYSELDINLDREYLYKARAQAPEITFDRYLSVEEMIIQTQTCFVDTENKSAFISVISKLSKDSTVELLDDGVTQKVKVSQGVATKSEVALSPLVRLAPYRTFFEVDQPEQLFLVRINQHTQVALFDAAGGMWKQQCQEVIREYLHNEFLNEVAEGEVIIG